MKKVLLALTLALIATSCQKSKIDKVFKKYEYTCTFWDYANGKMNLASKRDFQENYDSDSMENWYMLNADYDSVSCVNK